MRDPRSVSHVFDSRPLGRCLGGKEDCDRDRLAIDDTWCPTACGPSARGMAPDLSRKSGADDHQRRCFIRVGDPPFLASATDLVARFSSPPELETRECPPVASPQRAFIADQVAPELPAQRAKRGQIGGDPNVPGRKPDTTHTGGHFSRNEGAPKAPSCQSCRVPGAEPRASLLRAWFPAPVKGTAQKLGGSR